MLSHLSRTARSRRTALVPAVAFAAAALAIAPSISASAASSPRAHLAADWQVSQLDPDGTIPSDFPGFVDWGLTIDTALMLSAEGNDPDELALVGSAIEDHYYTDYATFEGTIAANAMSKALVAADVMHANVRDYGGHNLRSIVVNRIAGPAAGREQGRIRDKTTQDLPTDFSNTLGQSYGVIGLARTGPLPTSTVDYLLRQRCSEGFFRINPVKNHTCDQGDADQSPPDVDATALAIQALLVARQHGVTLPKGTISGTVAWLQSVQKPNGAFGGGASTPGRNTNSTGLAAQALAAAGRDTSAGLAKEAVRDLQITKARAGNGPAKTDVGTIAYNRAAFNDALADGLTESTRGQFRRATPQAYFALNPVSLGELSAP